ncbi:hypothetical protein GTP38_08585 [Duganella sp. FT94W]|uniref:DUF1640 domain-containing protein n=1 Tax=Duganella lactea TaxID=2692173 RepID=A0ABW9V6T0_9BURK|nr:hypothetical protein [Duganella lactea]MYM34392.1 hypothetical protein [Duganella lactea]
MANNFNTVAFKSLASALFQLIDSHLVTKDELDIRLAELRAEFRESHAALKAELIQWMCGILVVQTGMTAVLFKLLH